MLSPLDALTIGDGHTAEEAERRKSCRLRIAVSGACKVAESLGGEDVHQRYVQQHS